MDYNNMVWSYSRVNSYHTCPRMFKLNYMDKLGGGENAFSQFGGFVHELIEEILLGSLTREKAIKKYKDDYKKRVTSKFPKNKYVDLAIKYEQQGLTYLQWAKLDEYKTIDVEKYVEFDVAGYKFRGYIDWLAKNDKGLILIDHKSKASISKAEHQEYFRQLYLYSIPVIEEFKQEPIGLVLNLFRSVDIVKEGYTKEGLQEAIRWAETTIESIKKDMIFEKKLNPKKDFFCKEICSFRKECVK